MTKKEQLAFEALQCELRIARAFRFTESVAPDVPPPDSYTDPVTGWTFHAWSDGYRVGEAWTTSVSHGTGKHVRSPSGRINGACQNSLRLYSSELLALKAARYALEAIFSRRLAEIDKRIEEQQCKGGAA